MDKSSFNLLPLEDRLIILKTEAEELLKTPSLGNVVTLYSFNGYLVEEYRKKESNELVKIESITKENEQERLNKYAMYIEFANEALNFSKRNEKKALTLCLSCDYEWFPDEKMLPRDVYCPVCDGRKWTFLFRKECSNCNSIFYSGGGIYKRVCPKCK